MMDDRAEVSEYLANFSQFGHNSLTFILLASFQHWIPQLLGARVPAGHKLKSGAKLSRKNFYLSPVSFKRCFLKQVVLLRWKNYVLSCVWLDLSQVREVRFGGEVR